MTTRTLEPRPHGPEPLDAQVLDRRAHPSAARFSDWRAPDGWRHRRIDWPRPKGEARGTLLFLGGRGDFIEKYMEAMAHWHELGWAVTSFDWRGQGASRGDIEGGHLESFEPLVADLAALAGEFGAQPGPLVAVGHSMGGHVLLRAIAEEKVRLDAAVLVAPMLGINSAPLPAFAAWWTAALFANLGLRRQPAWRTPLPPPPPGSARQAWLTSCPERYSDELFWWKREPGFHLGAPSWGWLDAAYRSIAALTDEKLRRAETPMLLVGTEADRLVSAAAIHRAAALLPDARLRMFERAGHEILREADPVRGEALAAIGAFLDEAVPR
ncbi:MAG TPA: alpha/beta hydrolase [Allosphingosinicella sp.]|jgi:lysophospholipase